MIASPPLKGINVIDLGWYFAGPMVGMNLADQGANVIRIIRPGQLEIPKQQFQAINRNKKVLELDLKSQSGRNQLMSLLEETDVLIENFRPGVMKRLELDYSSLKQKFPALIYLSLPGFASTDTDRAHIQAWEGLLSAAAGVFVETQSLQRILGNPPTYTDVPQCSAYGAAHGSIAILAALNWRHQSGCGERIEVPLVEAGLSGFASAMLTHAPLGEIPPKMEQYRYDASDCNETLDAKLKAAFKMSRGSPLYTYWLCADERHILIWGAGGVAFTERFMKVLEIDKRLKEAGFINETAEETNNNISMPAFMSPSNLELLLDIVGERLLTKPAEFWETRLGEAGVPCSMIRTKDEFLSLKPMYETGVLTRLENEEMSLVMPGRVADVSRSEEQAEAACFNAPSSIKYEEALSYFGVTPEKNDASKKVKTSSKKRDLLKGVKVLDLANIVAGPTASYTLAQYGADVIKIDPDNFTTELLEPVMMEVNQGKRSMLVDLKTAPGQKILTELLKWADILIHNSLDDAALRLGLNHSRLQQINSNLISCQLTAFGGSQKGGWELRKGFDPVAPACSGLMIAHGTMTNPQIHGGMSAADINAGLGLAFSALVALHQRNTTSFAGEGRTSLIRTNSHFQFPLLSVENIKQNQESNGLFIKGKHFLYRIYKCSDAYLFVAADETQADALLNSVVGDVDAGEMDLESAFSNKPYREWQSIINNAGIACHPVFSLEDIHEQNIRVVDPHASDEVATGAQEVFLWKEHPRGSSLKLLAASWVRVGEQNSYFRLRPKPFYGQHTNQVLRELGFLDDEIEVFRKFKIIKQHGECS